MIDGTELSVGAAIGAAGSFFAEKIFGPTADALGHSLQAYLATKWQMITQRAGLIAKSAGIEPSPIEPGLLARFVMDSSFSADDEGIREWWANLLVEAAVSQSNHHAAFSDILATLGPREAEALRDFAGIEFLGGPAELPVADLEQMIFDCLWPTGEKFVGRDGMNKAIAGTDFHWPVRVIEWSIPPDDGSERAFQTWQSAWYSQNIDSLSLLQRASLIKLEHPTYSAWGGNVWVRALVLTALGKRFLLTCTGENRSRV